MRKIYHALKFEDFLKTNPANGMYRVEMESKIDHSIDFLWFHDGEWWHEGGLYDKFDYKKYNYELTIFVEQSQTTGYENNIVHPTRDWG